jgi:hypothetical protein
LRLPHPARTATTTAMTSRHPTMKSDESSDHSILLPPPAQHPRRRFAQPAKPRRSVFKPKCQHEYMTKIWDPCGALKCSRCSRPATDGFLWRCTTDTNGNLLSSDFSNSPSDHTITTFLPSTATMSQSYENLDQDVRAFIEQGDYTVEEKNTLPELKPWILRTIANAHYTHDHIKLFIEHKNNVPRTIRTQLGVQERPDTSSSSFRPATSSTSARSDTSDYTTTTIASQPLVQATDEAIDEYYWSEAHRAWHSSTHRLR